MTLLQQVESATTLPSLYSAIEDLDALVEAHPAETLVIDACTWYNGNKPIQGGIRSLEPFGEFDPDSDKYEEYETQQEVRMLSSLRTSPVSVS